MHILLPVFAAGLASAPAPAIPAPAERVDYFDIEGSTAAEIFADLKRRGPNAGGGLHALASTQAEYRHESTLAYSAGGPCRATDIRVSLSLTFTIPRWTGEGAASDSVRAWWSDLLASIWDHERGHASIALDGARQISDALNAAPPAATCDDLDEDMRRRMRRVLAQSIEPAQARFDSQNRTMIRLDAR